MKIQRRRRVLLAGLIIALLAVTGFFVLKSHLAIQLKELVESKLAKEIDGRVKIGQLAIATFSPSVELQNVSLASKRLGVEDLFLKNVKITVSPFPIFFGRIILSEVKIDNATIQLTDPRKLVEKEPTGIESVLPRDFAFIQVIVENGTIESGHIDYRDQAGQLHASMTIEQLQAVTRRSGALELDLKAQGNLQFNDFQGVHGNIPIESLVGAFSYNNRDVAIEKLTVAAPNANFLVHGEAYPKLAITAEGSIDTSKLPVDLPVKGEIDFTTSLTGSFTYPKVNFSLSSNNLNYEAVRFDEIALEGFFDPSELNLKTVQVKQKNGILTGNGYWKKKRGDLNTNITLKDFPTSTLLPLIGDHLPQKNIDVDARLSGNILVAGGLGNRSNNRALDIKTDLQIPLFAFKRGNFSINLNQLSLQANLSRQPGKSRLDIANATLSSNEISTSVSGYVDSTDTALSFNAQLTDIWKVFYPNRDIVAGPINATGNYHSLDNESTLAMDLSAEDLIIAGEPNWSLVGRVKAVNSLWSMEKLRIFKPSAELKIQGQVDVASQTLSGISVETKDLPSKFFVNILPANLQVLFRENYYSANSVVNTHINTHGSWHQPTSQGSLKITDFKVANENIDLIELEFSSDNSVVQINPLLLRKDESRVEVSGSIDLTGSRLDLGFETFDLKTTTLSVMAEFLEHPSLIKVSGTIKGPLESPNVIGTASLLSEDLETLLTATYEKVGLGDWIARINFDDNESQVRIGYGDRLQIEASLIDFAPFSFLQRLGGNDYGDLQAKVSGKIELAAKSAEALSGTIALTSLDLRQGNNAFVERSSAKLRLTDGNIYLEQCSLDGSSIYLRCDEDKRVQGFVDIAILPPLLPFFGRTEGKVSIDAKVVGPLNAFNFEGQAQLTGGVLTFDDFPTLFEDLSIDAEFKKNHIKINDLKAKTGAGGIHASGDINFQAWERAIFDLVAEVKSMPVRIPEEFPGVASGRVKFYGPDNEAVLEGNVIVERLRYTKRFDWRSQFLFVEDSKSSIDKTRVLGQGSVGTGVYFNLRCRTEEPVLVIENNVSDIRLAGNFNVIGKFPIVSLIGDLNVDSGTIEFSGQTFDIDSGTVLFRDEKNVTPIVDVYATTRIDQYTVTMNINTVNDRIRVDMSSTPPLNETDLLALITVGSVNNTFNSNASSNTNLTEGVAIGLVSGTLQEKVENIGLIDTFQVVPDFSEADQTNNLRIMLGKDVTRGLKIIYSTDLYNVGANQEVRLKQNIERNFSVLGSIKDSEVNQTVDLGVDFEFSLDF